MGASYGKQKTSKSGKLNVGRFTALPHTVIHSQQYRQLGYAARALLFDLAAQYNRNNNGKLVCCMKYLRPLGWNSNDTITRALRELLKSGLLIQTRQGMMPPCSQAAWFAIGWFGLDVTTGLDIEPTKYRRCVLIHFVIPSPIIGALKRKIAPKNGIATLKPTPNPTPKSGTVKAINDESTTPINGDFIDLPSNYSIISQNCTSEVTRHDH